MLFLKPSELAKLAHAPSVPGYLFLCTLYECACSGLQFRPHSFFF